MINTVVEAAWITGISTIVAALIGIVGVVAIVWNRKRVIELCKEVERYHKHEGWLVTKLLEKSEKESTDEMVIKWRGEYRKLSFGDKPTPSMTEKQALSIRRKYASFD
jgi:hypothetical protein